MQCNLCCSPDEVGDVVLVTWCVYDSDTRLAGVERFQVEVHRVSLLSLLFCLIKYPGKRSRGDACLLENRRVAFKNPFKIIPNLHTIM